MIPTIISIVALTIAITSGIMSLRSAKRLRDELYLSQTQTKKTIIIR